MNRRQNLRNMINDENKVIEVVGAHNGLTAKLVEQNGFDAIWASGLEISASHAKPDANILTMTEFLNAASQMVEATNIPVIADCDQGFGNVNNVIRMVKDYEKAGISGICIEDKQFPKLNSFINGNQALADISEFCGKILAAKETQIDPNFLVIARVEALIAGENMDVALERAEAFRNAGADMILIHSKHSSPIQILEFSKKWNNRSPLVVVPTTYPMFNLDDLRINNIKMTIYANQSLRSALKAMNQTLRKLKKEGSLSAIEDELVSMKEVFALQDMENFTNETKRYEDLGKGLIKELSLVNN